MRVLLLEIDGLQPAYMGPYGCEWVPTPTWDRWAAAGVVFDQHFAGRPEPGNWTDEQLLADLKAAGVRMARVGPPRPAGGWEVDLPIERGAQPLALKPARRAVRQAIEQLGDAAHALLTIELDALLPPWQPSDETIADCFGDEEIELWTGEVPERIADDDDATFARLQNTYAAAVATLDAGVSKLLGDCEKRGWGDEAVWILTAGRGFPLGERGPVGFAAADLYEELVHLPLMIRWPHGEHASWRTSALTQPANLATAIREFFDRPVANGLVALARGGDTPIRKRVVSRLDRGGRTSWGFRSPGWYLVLDDAADGERRLFVKPDDRWEVNDVRSRNLELAEEMEKEFFDSFSPRSMTGG